MLRRPWMFALPLLVPALASAQSPESTAPRVGTSGARQILPISPLMLEPAEGERIVCTRRSIATAMDVRRQPMGRFAARTGDPLPTVWSVTVGQLGRSVTIRNESPYRPREVTVLYGRSAADGRVQEAVRVLFLTDGTPQDGERVLTPSVRDSGAARPIRGPLDSLDAPRLYELARELVFRCERGMTEPVPLGSVQGQIPPG